MADLEPQEEDSSSRDLCSKSISCLDQIRSHRMDESWSVVLCQTFFVTSVGAHIPLITEGPLSASGCRKFQLDSLGDHLNICTHSEVEKAHDWVVDQMSDLFHKYDGSGTFGSGPPY